MSLAILIAAATGFIALSYEIVWFRVYSFASGGSPASFGVLLGYYLTGLAIGAHVAGSIFRHQAARVRRYQFHVLFVVMFLASLVGYLVIPAFNWLVTRVYWVQLGFLITLAASLFGATFPLISDLGIEPDERAGLRLSWVYLSNIVGSALGSLITGFVLLDVWTLQAVAIALALVGLAAMLLLIAKLNSVSTKIVAAIAVAGAMLLVVGISPRAFDRLYERLLFKQGDVGVRFADVVENKHGIITVTSSHQVFGSGVYDGVISTSIVDDKNGIVRAYGVAALHRRPREVLIIGLATGAWAQVIVNAPGVERVVIVEINPGYLTLIKKYPQVASLLTNRKVEIVIDDGRRWLVHHPDRTFDVIVQNTTEHARAYATNLLSMEYLKLVREHLKPGGVLHFNTTESEDAYKTAFAVFPHGLRFINFASVSDAPVEFDREHWRDILIGYRIDGRRVIDLAQPHDRQRLDSLLDFASSVDRLPVRFGLEKRASMLTHLSRAGIITDDNMLCEWRGVGLSR